GESESDFAELVEFVRESRFERVGVFQYSQEENTSAATLPDQVAEDVKRSRYDLLMRAQAEVAAEMNRDLIGKQVPVLVCGSDERGRLYGRMASQAPDIDGVVYLRGSAPAGSIVRARITAADTYDLRAQVILPSSQSAVDSVMECHYIPAPAGA